MTEHYFDPDDIGTCMQMAKEILDCMYYNMSGYVWWYLKTPNCNLINAGGSFKKKAYMLGQFSKYIRPGYYRVDATYNPQSGVYITAYKGEKVVVVAINQSTSSKSQQVAIQNGLVASVTKYVSSASKGFTNDGTLTLTGGVFTTSLDSQSITTFVQN